MRTAARAPLVFVLLFLYMHLLFIAICAHPPPFLPSSKDKDKRKGKRKCKDKAVRALDSGQAMAAKLRDYQLQLYLRLLCAAMAREVATNPAAPPPPCSLSLHLVALRIPLRCSSFCLFLTCFVRPEPSLPAGPHAL